MGIALVLVFVFAIPASATETSQQCGVLFISSVDPDQPGIADLLDETRTAIQDAIERPTHFDVEYLDPQLSGPNPNADVKTAEFFRAKYSRQRFELIITIGPRALRFAKDYAAELFPEAKILSLMLSLSPSQQPSASRWPSATFYVAPDFAPTLDLALLQNPGTQQVVLVAGSSPEDVLQLRRARASLASHENRLRFVELTNDTFDQLKRKLSELDPDSIILFVDFTADSTGEEYINTRILRELSQSANRPMYGAFREQVGQGVVGGSVIDMREVGQALSRTAVRVLQGEKPGDVLFSALQQHYVFDARQLRRWSIGQLPSGSRVLNQEYGPWTLYKERFVVLSLAVCLEALLIVFLFKTVFRRKRAERELARLLAVERLESSLSASMIHLPIGLVREEIHRGFSQFIQFFRIDCISIYEFDEQTAEFRLLFYSSLPGTRLRLSQLKPSDFKDATDTLLSGQTVVVRTVSEIPHESFRVMRNLRKSGLSSFAGIPVALDKRVVGALFFSSAKDRDWDATLLEELRLIANIVGSGLDRARTHDSLARSEQLKSAILASLPASVVVLDRKGYVIDFNRSANMASFACNFGRGSLGLGADYPELCRRAADQGSKYAHAALNGLQDVLLRASVQFEMEYPWEAAGREYWSLMSIVPLSAEQGGVVVTHIDVTERKLAELERKQLETARGELSGKLLRAQEQERARVARELHDDINQKLGLLAVDIQTLQQRVPEMIGDVRGELDVLFKTTNRISADVQRLSHQLHSSRLDYLGLAAALRRLCSEFAEQHNLPIECFIESTPEKLSREIGLAFFRIAQECLTNVVKHSSATRAVVRLQCPGEMIRMSVSDDGTGFSPDKVGLRNDPGLGLISMRERLRLVNGDLVIHSKEGHGTEVIAFAPFRKEEISAQPTSSMVEKKLA